MAVTTTNLGVITAYGDAVAAGYTGTKAEWQTLMASYATVGQQAVDAKNDAVAAKDIAVQKATDASTAAGTATQKANEASASAQSIAQSASQITQNTSDISELKEDFTQMESDGVVPSAEQILTDKGVTDSVPYHYRKTGGNGADRLYDQIVGGTVCWNQLVKLDTVNTQTSNGVTFTKNPDGSYAISGTATGRVSTATNVVDRLQAISGHKYFIGLSTNISPLRFRASAGISNLLLAESTVVNCTADTNMYFAFDSLATITDTFNIPRLLINISDLTAMFGTTIADYVYSLETATAGAGVEWLKSHFPRIFDSGYIPYNVGTLEHVGGLSAHKMTGFNQWDEEWEVGRINGSTGALVSGNGIRSKNYIPVFANTSYYVKGASNLIVCQYDENKNFISTIIWGDPNQSVTTSADAKYLKVGTFDSYGNVYKNDICINLSDPTKNGAYEPYKAHSYPLDDSLTLRGLFKLDANNKLYADGDTYEYTGKVTRNTILRAYQSGDESLANAITDGTNTVIYSASASVETADLYQHLQQCDPNGTEEYVSTGIVPVGHNSFYPENLRAKIEGLPWNFTSLIAPTESTFTATRNYTTGALFIVSNVLYKATSNIATGGTITPNTNCTATTLAEIISALA